MKLTGTHRVRTSSGNVCTATISEQGDNIAVGCMWEFKPDKGDQTEIQSWLIKLLPVGTQIGNMLSASHGLTSKGGREKSAEAIQRFLETGDPGVPPDKE